MEPLKPLLLIDVDGPLNPYAAKSQRRPQGYSTHRMRPRGWSEAESRRPLRVWLNRGHGAELLALADTYELVWATTWKDEANDWIGPSRGSTTTSRPWTGSTSTGSTRRRLC